MFGEFTIAVHPWFVQEFALIIGCNCIINCILWLFYVYNHSYCKSHRFESISFIFGTIGDLFYTLFPLTLFRDDNQSLLFNFQALGHFRSENSILFLGVLTAMIFMVKKCHKILNTFDPTYIEYRNKTYIALNVSPISYLDRDTYRTNRKCSCPKFLITLVAIIYLALGGFIIGYTFNFIKQASNYCQNPGKDDIRLSKNYELLYWDSCVYKVYPMNEKQDTPDVCECRMMNWVIDNHSYYANNFDLTHVSAVLESWTTINRLIYLNPSKICSNLIIHALIRSISQIKN